MTAKELLELVASLEGSVTTTNGNHGHSYKVGESYLVRATYHHIGRLVAVTDTDLVLEDGGWLADSGRFSECLANGTYSELEIVPIGMRRIVSRADIIDAFPWTHELPTVTK